VKIQEYATKEHALAVMDLVVSELDKFSLGRYSATLVNQLVYLPYQGMNYLYQFIVPEIAHLEDETLPTRTGKEESFRRPEMQGLYKKHFYLPCFAAKNMLNSWNLAGESKSTKFEKEFKRTYEVYQATQSEESAKKLSSDIAATMMNELLSKKKTGEYIVFQKYNDKNYYLCLGLHRQDEEILSWVKHAQKDFSFLNNTVAPSFCGKSVR